MISAGDLSMMRAIQEQALPGTCTRRRAVHTQDASGVYIESTSSSTTLACRISIRGIPQEFVQAAAAQGEVPVMITVPQGSDVVASDQLIVNGVTYEILGFASIGEWETAMRCVCVAIG